MDSGSLVRAACSARQLRSEFRKPAAPRTRELVSRLPSANDETGLAASRARRSQCCTCPDRRLEGGAGGHSTSPCSCRECWGHSKHTPTTGSLATKDTQHGRTWTHAQKRRTWGLSADLSPKWSQYRQPALDVAPVRFSTWATPAQVSHHPRGHTCTTDLVRRRSRMPS